MFLEKMAAIKREEIIPEEGLLAPGRDERKG